MHTFGETGAGVPAFLAKLWRLVEDPETNNLICWSKDGRSFIIQNQAQFARELLPLNYKHNNMASFIRQLNMYGFHKITSIDNGGLKFDRDEMEFTHPCFKRNCAYLLEHIKRKIASTKAVDDKSALKPEAVSKVLQDVKAMRGRQDSLDSRFSVMKQENEALWREIASLRQKHAKQQQIVNKLIQFLITIVQPTRNMTSVKRHMQLMINDTPENAKVRKTSESESDCGPVIHELGEELLDEVADVDQDLIVPNSPFGKSTPSHTDPDGAASPQNIERPHSSISMISQNYDYSNQSTDDVIGYMHSPKANNIGQGAVVQAVSPDGSKIVYHVTEVPDAQPHDATPAAPANYNEDNVLTTPMVREEMARTQLMKQKNKHKRSHNSAFSVTDSETKAKVQRLTEQQQKQQQQQQHAQPIEIKSEKDINSMLFLNVYPENRGVTPDPNLISPNLSDDSHQSNPNGAGFTTTSTSDNGLMVNNTELYNPNNFITNDIPADLFEESSIVSAGEHNNFNNDNLKLSQQQQYGRSTVNNGKFSSYIAGNNANNNSNSSNSRGSSNSANGASTSAAAAAASSEDANTNAKATASSSGSSNATQSAPGKGGSNNMALTKYKNEDIMRDEVNGHLDNVQDELDSLKDLLRGDMYSLDHNTLLGLFNDSEILGPYGLSLSNEANNDKKGSELMTYQPMYDLSDIINDQSDLDAENDVTPSTSSRQLQNQDSELNTPYHE